MLDLSTFKLMMSLIILWVCSKENLENSLPRKKPLLMNFPRRISIILLMVGMIKSSDALKVIKSGDILLLRNLMLEINNAGDKYNFE